jgi:hypothetical protein
VEKPLSTSSAFVRSLRCTAGHCSSHCFAGASVLNSAITSRKVPSAMPMTALTDGGTGIP